MRIVVNNAFDIVQRSYRSPLAVPLTVRVPAMKKSLSTRVIGVSALLFSISVLLNCGTGHSVKLETISIAPANPALAKGESMQLDATGNYSDGHQESLTDSVAWTSSETAIVEIDQNGKVTGMGEGATKVSAALNGVTGTTYVTIGAPALVGISVTPNPSSLPLGESEQLVATGAYSDGSSQNITQTATWSSSGTAIASVSISGSVQATGIGNATISATSGSVTGNAAVTVAQAVLLGIAVSPSASSLPLGESEQLTATGKFSDGTQQDLTQSVTWAASGTGIVTVSATGSVLGAAVGAAVVTATQGTVTGNASVAVGQAALLSLAVTPNNFSLPLDESQQLAATGTFSDGSTQDLTQVVTWASSATGTASVSPAGAVHANAIGSATISATAGAISGSSAVTVGQAALVSIAVSPNGSSLPVGESEQLTATGTYSDGSTQNLSQSATWASSAMAIATANPGGSVVANAVGSATISATVGSISGSASLNATAPVIVSIDVEPATMSIILGNTGQLKATATWSDGTTQDVTSVASWSSTPAGMVDVSASGLVTAQQVGTTTIFATDNGVTGTSSVTVTPLMLVNYYSRVNAVQAGVDTTMEITNPGPLNLCAMVYVFDTQQELNECCNCPVSDGGLVALSLLNDLTANPLTGIEPNAGMILVVPADISLNPLCDPSTSSPTGELAAWETNVNDVSSAAITETAFLPLALNSTSATQLQQLCGFIETEGSGSGVCTCGTGDGSGGAARRRK